jgi:hypothetical protein
MTRKMTEWPFENGQTDKVGPSDGFRGNAIPLAADPTYDFRELETYLGNVGFTRPRGKKQHACSLDRSCLKR